jgi:AhpC/TSA family.
LKQLALIFCLYCSLSACGSRLPRQTASEPSVGYAISLKAQAGGISSSSPPISLAVQQGEHILIVDSLPLTQTDGTLLFSGPEPLVPGQYLFIQHDRRLFPFLISFQEHQLMTFSAHIQDGHSSQLEVIGSEENNAYIAFQNYVIDFGRKASFSEADFARFDAYTDSVAKAWPNTILAMLARNASSPPLPEYMALDDIRILHTSILPLRLRNLFDKIVPPSPEFVIPQVEQILKRATVPDVKAYCAHFLLTYFMSSPIMGLEAVVIHLAQNYYLNHTIPLRDSSLLPELATYVEFTKQSLVGLPAPELLLQDLQGGYRSLRELPAPYTILLFYDDACVICREVLPEIQEVYQKYAASKNLAVYAVYAQTAFVAWQDYAAGLPHDWVHVWDPEFSSGFHRLYGVTGTPELFLIGPDKTILGRELTPSALQQMLSLYLAP